MTRGSTLFFTKSALPLLLILAGGCEHQGAQPITMDGVRSETEPVEEVREARIRLSDEGLPRVYISAPHMRTYETQDSTYTVLESDTSDRRVVVRVFDERGQPSAVIEADRVLRHERDGRYEARGDVEVVTLDGKRLEAEYLNWSEAERTIWSGGFVQIETPEGRVSGYELAADEDLDPYRIERGSGMGRVNVPEE